MPPKCKHMLGCCNSLMLQDYWPHLNIYGCEHVLAEHAAHMLKNSTHANAMVAFLMTIAWK